MAVVESWLPRGPIEPHDRDEFVVLHGVAWETYCTARDLFDSAGVRVRMTYLKGALEIMTPSRRHEGYKKRIARLIELFALERSISLSGYGSTTFRKALAERGLEPDECYVLNRDLIDDDDSPDIALEVVISGGGIDKLEVYRGLGVREVWFWHKGQFQLYALRDEGYSRILQSELLPTLDFAELASLAEETDQLAALKKYRQRLQSS